MIKFLWRELRDWTLVVLYILLTPRLVRFNDREGAMLDHTICWDRFVKYHLPFGPPRGRGTARSKHLEKVVMSLIRSGAVVQSQTHKVDEPDVNYELKDIIKIEHLRFAWATDVNGKSRLVWVDATEEYTSLQPRLGLLVGLRLSLYHSRALDRDLDKAKQAEVDNFYEKTQESLYQTKKMLDTRLWEEDNK